MRRLVSQEDSAMVPGANVPRSRFVNKYARKQTQDAGFLVPFLCEEVLPGDFIRYEAVIAARMATPRFPLMDNLRMDTFFFFVPNRLVWDEWKRFMGEQNVPSQSIDVPIPLLNITIGAYTTPGPNFDSPGLLANYLGLPCPHLPGGSYDVLALPFRAYELIYYEWFRDQNLNTTGRPTSGANGVDSLASYVLRRRNKSHDYFTSALPFPQKFSSPSIPLTGRAPVIGLAITNAGNNTTPNVQVLNTLGQVENWGAASGSTNNQFWINRTTSWSPSDPGVFADLSSSLANISINALRQSMQIQALLERDAMGGTRYTEIVRSHFGVISPDARQQRPEYIGGGSQAVEITPVANTQATGLGNLGAAATSFGQHRASYASTEHGWIIGICNIKAELTYSEAMHKQWLRRTRYDFYWPSLAELGEQAIVQREIVQGPPAQANNVWGYQERWHEYRTMYNTTAGLFRTTLTGALVEWHLGQNFNFVVPPLAADFIAENPPMARVLAAGAGANQQQFLVDIDITRDAVRPIPQFGNPARLGRF
ncbi:major capsid protein [Apis mellifera associated microvirus 11]|nr:major capsid protein [Apis mellifera associated microvirus 11]AZL82778.1 major capsid protein [Apis mellifera associated microvirus 11]